LNEARHSFSLDKYRFRSLLLFHSLRGVIHTPLLGQGVIDCLRKTLSDRHYDSIWD
jgi:hypothetical protein